jgi:hypothetical protein
LTKGVRSSEGVVVVRSVGTQFDEVKVVTWKVKSNLREVALGYALRLKMHHVISLELGPSFSAQRSFRLWDNHSQQNTSSLHSTNVNPVLIIHFPPLHSIPLRDFRHFTLAHLSASFHPEGKGPVYYSVYAPDN